MYPWRRILIPTDFSTATEWVFDDAARAAAATGAEIIILHVRLAHRSAPEKLRFPADDSVYEYVEEHELEVLRRHVERQAPGVRTRLIVRRSPDPAGEIQRTSEQEDVDLVVMATHGRHHIAHFFLGSTTMGLLGRCSRPVLAIRYGIRKPLAMKTIVAAIRVDAEENAQVDLALEIARREQAELRMITVVASKDDVTRAEEQLARRASAAAPLDVRIAVMEGRDPAKEIIRYADFHGVDLTVISTGCAPGSRISDVAEDILRSVSTPVLVVPGR